MLASPAGQKEDGSSIPLYMLCLDLAFAASWSVAAQWITYGDDAAVPRYFLIFVPIAWVWDQTNRVFNRFDTKDIVSEVVVVFIMILAMVIALNTRACFFAELIPQREAPSLDLQRKSCAYFSASLAVARALLGAFVLYVAWFERRARRLAWRELVAWLCLAPVMVAVVDSLLNSDGHSDGFRTRLPILLALAAAADCAVSCGDALLPSTSAWARRVDSGVMLDAAYTISRYERMVIIAIGAICANAIHVAGFSPALDPDGFDTHAFAVCWATPWAAFVIKVEYFDLSQYHGSDAGLHATRTSRLRSVLWSLCHMPLLGTIFWISTALATLLDGKNDGAPDWEFGAAFATYLGLSSLMQAMHHQDKSAGVHRRCPKRSRIVIRLLFTAVLCGLQPLLMQLPRSQASTIAAINLALLTVSSAVGLYGRSLTERSFLAAFSGSGSFAVRAVS